MGGPGRALARVSRRAAALLNGRGQAAPETTKISRGDLALRAVTTGDMPRVEFARYDPFHLVLAEPSGARVFSWDGVRLGVAGLAEGTSMVVNTGVDPSSERVAGFLPRFESSSDWRELLAGDPSDDPGALLVRHELPDGRVFASLSVMTVELDPGGVTYDFTDLTADPDR
ncbi:hypothetical protein [Nonomuraea cavernae]|uniref:Uncharacterized protein n=1 Tax=Nonomuraea cavernae TaxID=2045107 RepID=A0A918DN47_9ACTN|nr:hypothetical protein [Nonomuraea cavernae]MCA2189162.1 hypothetical protein [Nonomuraea cavernae]GGO76353.1 hypothetical protein GCM10012289_53520 [Nonomuraea cavernae]